MRDFFRIEGEGVAVELRRHGREEILRPVLLLPGLGANSRVFTLHPEQPLHEVLQQDGRSVWTLDFAFNARRDSGQDFEALLVSLRSALAVLDQDAGQREFDVVGHSMGGLLALALAAEGQPLCNLAVLGAAVDYRAGASTLRAVAALASVGRRLPKLPGIPVRNLASLGAPFFGRSNPAPFQAASFHRGRTDGAVIRRYIAEAVADLPMPLLLNLADLFREDGLRFGPERRVLRDAMMTLPHPVLLVAARQDRQCPLDAIRDTARRLPGGLLLEIGPLPLRDDEDEATSDVDGWGHLDLLSGRGAVQEVFEPIRQFLIDPDSVGLAGG